MNLKKIGKVLTSKSVGTGPSFCEKIIYRVTVSQRLRNTALDGGQLSASSSGRSTPEKRAPGTFLIAGGWIPESV